MGDQVLLLVIGFALTSILGGAFGLFFQTRSWSHQHRAQQHDQERQQAIKVFEEVSSLLDKRLHRMRLVFWAAKRRAQATGNLEALREALDEYRKVVAAWNDNLNRTLALVHTYFGGATRSQLERHIYEEYSAIGRALDQFVRDVSASDHPDVDVPPIGRRLTWLGREVYAFNVRMLELLQGDQLGRAAPTTEPSRQSATPVLQFGSQGSAVKQLQRALRRAGEFDARIDGSFGRETEEAVRSAQRSAGLDVDAVVGASTWDALPSSAPMPTLAEGSHGEVVATLQAVLAAQAPSRWTTSPAAADGVFGAATSDAVRAFQRWSGLSSDGVVGEATWAARVEADGKTLEMAVELEHADQRTAPSRRPDSGV